MWCRRLAGKPGDQDRGSFDTAQLPVALGLQREALGLVVAERLFDGVVGLLRRFDGRVVTGVLDCVGA